MKPRKKTNYNTDILKTFKSKLLCSNLNKKESKNKKALVSLFNGYNDHKDELFIKYKCLIR